MFNLALGLSILFSTLAMFLFKSAEHWLTPAAFCGITIMLFVFLLLTSEEQYLKPSKLVHWVFGIANSLVLIGFAEFSLGTHAGANAIGAGMFVGVYFFAPGLALLLCGSIALAAQSIKNRASHP